MFNFKSDIQFINYFKLFNIVSLILVLISVGKSSLKSLLQDDKLKQISKMVKNLFIWVGLFLITGNGFGYDFVAGRKSIDFQPQQISHLKNTILI